jgi:hypothetical protein
LSVVVEANSGRGVGKKSVSLTLVEQLLDVADGSQ